MTQYIPKDAFVAKIDDWRHNIMTGIATLHGRQRVDAAFEHEILGIVRDFINTLEVKEVDLESEVEKCLKKYQMLAVGKKDFTDIAKTFFELGMQVSNKAQKGEEV